MSKIFISYRRSDSKDVAGRLYDHLLKKFKKSDLFKDVDSIPAATNFKEYITETIKSCDVMIVVIGSGWLTATNDNGLRRLDEIDDVVRFEIETALSQKLVVLPVLVGGAETPKVKMLPDSLKSLAAINALSVRPDPDFHNDTNKLIRSLQGILKIRSQSKGKSLYRRLRDRRYIIGSIVLFIAVLSSTQFFLKWPINYSTNRLASNISGDSTDLKNTKMKNNVRVYITFRGGDGYCALELKKYNNEGTVLNKKVRQSTAIDFDLEPGSYFLSISGNILGTVEIWFQGYGVTVYPKTPMKFSTTTFHENREIDIQ